MELRFNVFNLIRIDPNAGAGIKHAITLTLVKPSEDDGEALVDTELQCPKVGWVVLAENSNFWYHTSTVTEIISEEESEECVTTTFKTLNSTYQLDRF
jgi:hypothetical protein